MKNSIITPLLCTLLCFACSNTEKMKELHVDLEKTLSVDSLNDFLEMEKLVHIPCDQTFISNFDKVISGKDEFFVLDKTQQAVFKIDTHNRSIEKIIHSVGKAKNEYIKITDIAMDNQHNIYVFDNSSRKINIHDSEGNYMHSIEVVCGTSIAVSDEGQIAINCNRLEKDLIVIFSSSGKELYRIKNSLETPDFVLENPGGITAWGKEFIYSTPFDYTVYQTKKGKNTPVAVLSFGEEQFDAANLKGVDYRGFQETLFQNADKIMTFQQLGKYKDFIFLSTDLGHQLMIDMKKNSVTNLSETESPYNRLFSSPLCVGKDGQFCCVISSSAIGTKFLEKLNGKDSKLPKLQTVYEKEDIEDEEEESFWMLTGQIREQ